MKYYYARVSSETQNLDRQVELFKEMGANDRVIFQEKKSGKSLENREVWNELLNTWIKSGDIIIVKNLDRIGRNAKEVRECILNLAKRNIILESIDQGGVPSGKRGITTLRIFLTIYDPFIFNA